MAEALEGRCTFAAIHASWKARGQAGKPVLHRLGLRIIVVCLHIMRPGSRVIVLLLVLLSAAFLDEARAQDTTASDDDMTAWVNSYLVPKWFVVVGMEKRYDRALEEARLTAKRLRMKVDLRGLHPNRETGLSITKADADSNGWEYPTDYPRGRWDDGNYVSIEWSSDFDNQPKGRYMIVVASGYTGEEWLKASLAGTRKVYPRATLVTSKVFMGCMH